MGYKKHTLRLWFKVRGKNCLIPLVSFIEPANIYEGSLLHPMIQKAHQEFSMHIDIVVADMGYIGSDQKRELRKQYQTAVLTKTRENMAPPEIFGDSIYPECSEGIPLSWDGYDPETETHCYVPSMDCIGGRACVFSGHCYQEVYVPSSVDEHYFGPIPLHTQVAQRLLQKIRPQVERGIENDKNKLYLNRFFINSLKIARILGHLSDASQVLLLFAGMKTNTKSKSQKLMRQLYTQLSFDF